ncbi:hypothetical protein POM88_031199 [Heracleum sosnowskyi]|uniref:AP2/ERF domain-containing protein n=1 Tax=Heracleum sosnowskyi TaxID=360622 RepID=A0AAD8HXC1_9APIA|nr:hypothetical protein POM88_031199 [Heracleum sosnowskyi]
MEGENSVTSTRVKRPRSSLNPELQPHATSLVDQPAATTTVERSLKFRGVSRHHQSGRYEARFGNKYLYQLGTGCTPEEADRACDIAAIEHGGINAVTKFDLNTYIRWLRTGALSNCFHEECIKRKMQSDPSNKSSATALGILLQSSMYKELVEKNMNDETEENERKKFKLQSDDDKLKFVEESMEMM